MSAANVLICRVCTSSPHLAVAAGVVVVCHAVVPVVRSGRSASAVIHGLVVLVSLRCAMHRVSARTFSYRLRPCDRAPQDARQYIMSRSCQRATLTPLCTSSPHLAAGAGALARFTAFVRHAVVTVIGIRRKTAAAISKLLVLVGLRRAMPRVRVRSET